jgi:transposase
MNGKCYPEECNVEVVKQIVDLSHNIADVAKCLDATIYSLYTWVKKFGPNSKECKATSNEITNIRRLKKELKRIAEELCLLKS